MEFIGLKIWLLWQHTPDISVTSLTGKPTAFVQCGQWVYPLAAGKSPVLKSAPTTYMFPGLGRDGE